MLKGKLIVPCNNQSDIHPQVMKFLTELHKLRPELTVTKSCNALCSRARNEGIFDDYVDLLDPSALIKHDFIAFLDSDVLPDLEIYLRVLDSMTDDGVYTGTYKMRGAETFALGFIKGPDMIALNRADIAQTTNVDWTGGGLLFIGRKVFTKIVNPYFHEGVISWTDPQGVARSAIIGEDVMFSMKLTRAGYKINVINDLIAQHFV
jgi:cellulose synthase/poly-beta-1,6-N-acetylglucosamine synthase-like glycosyltransferase